MKVYILLALIMGSISVTLSVLLIDAHVVWNDNTIFVFGSVLFLGYAMTLIAMAKARIAWENDRAIIDRRNTAK